MTPTQRTLQECRRRGWIAQVVEKWNPHARVRQDLFGAIDIVAIDTAPGMTVKFNDETLLRVPMPKIIGIQACAGSSHATRRAKAIALPKIRAWIEAGARFEVWSWSKRGARGKRKTWQLRADSIAAADCHSGGAE